MPDSRRSTALHLSHALCTWSPSPPPPPPIPPQPLSQVTELLLQYGADPTEPNPRGGTALDMGANQGSWRECHVLLRDFPDLPQRLGKPIVEMEVGYTPSEGWGWGGQGGRGGEAGGEGEVLCGGLGWASPW